jgi:hypothetical protein
MNFENHHKHTLRIWVKSPYNFDQDLGKRHNTEVKEKELFHSKYCICNTYLENFSFFFKTFKISTHFILVKQLLKYIMSMYRLLLLI